MKKIFFVSILLIFFSCRKKFDAPIPNLSWDLFNAPGTQVLKNKVGLKIEGMYNIVGGDDRFGADAALKWTYTVQGTDTIFHLSFFCQKDITYIICEGKRKDSTILLNGYWRRMIGTETGKAWLTIAATNGGAKLLRDTALAVSDSIVITGNYGNGEDMPNIPITFRYARPLYKATPFE